MKIRTHYIALMAFAGIISCKKDNYSPPSAILSGHIVYKGEAIGVEYGQVPFEIYQYGFGKVGKLGNSSFAPDGSYSALLFNGTYKLDVPNGQGPFLWPQTVSGTPDSITITINGNKSLDLNVTPYYMIRNPQITGGGGKVTATFKVEKIITDAATAKDIQSVSLYVSKTQFASSTQNEVGKIDLAGAAIADPNNITLTVPVAAINAQNYVFARVAIQIAGVEDRILSPVQKITY